MSKGFMQDDILDMSALILKTLETTQTMYHVGAKAELRVDLVISLQALMESSLNKSTKSSEKDETLPAPRRRDSKTKVKYLAANPLAANPTVEERSREMSRVLYQINLENLSCFLQREANMALVVYFYLKNGLNIDHDKNQTTPCRHDALEYLFNVIHSYYSTEVSERI